MCSHHHPVPRAPVILLDELAFRSVDELRCRPGDLQHPERLRDRGHRTGAEKRCRLWSSVSAKASSKRSGIDVLAGFESMPHRAHALGSSRIRPAHDRETSRNDGNGRVAKCTGQGGDSRIAAGGERGPSDTLKVETQVQIPLGLRARAERRRPAECLWPSLWPSSAEVSRFGILAGGAASIGGGRHVARRRDR